MFYINFCIDNIALGHIQPHVVKNLITKTFTVNLQNWTEIIDQMNFAYINANPKGTACRTLIDLY